MASAGDSVPHPHGHAGCEGSAAARNPPCPPHFPTNFPPALVYVSDDKPGWRRVKRGDSFGYADEKGRAIKDEAQLSRIRSLAIPPAYTDVWICPKPNGHLQATGRDARGRKPVPLPRAVA